MSTDDKNKLDACGELIYAGVISGDSHTSSILSTTNVTNYRLLTFIIQPGSPNNSPDTSKSISISFNPSVIIGGTTIAQRQNLENWNDEAHLYVYADGGYIRANLGSAGNCTITRVIAYK